MNLKGQLNNCSKQINFDDFKRNLKKNEREEIQKEAYSKGLTNFISEANFFGNYLYW